MKAIASFELCQEGIADWYFWRASNSDRFTIKSALAFIRQDAPVGDISFWKDVWRINAPQRVRVFASLALNEKVMTNLHRFRKGLTNNPYCYICDQAHESVQHVLSDCPEANITWQALLAKGFGQLGANLSFKEWFLKNIRDPGKDGNWPTKFFYYVVYLEIEERCMLQ